MDPKCLDAGAKERVSKTLVGSDKIDLIRPVDYAGGVRTLRHSGNFVVEVGRPEEPRRRSGRRHPAANSWSRRFGPSAKTHLEEDVTGHHLM